MELESSAQSHDYGNEPVALSLRLPLDMMEALDAYAADADGSPDRQTVAVRILRDWLISNGYLRSAPLDGSVGLSET